MYIGIPFCPSICHYCSFSSTGIKNAGSLVDEYIDSLVFEIDETLKASKTADFRAVYIGGGTPTALGRPLLEKLLNKVGPLVKKNVEFTVEAGRPDTIDEDKLAILKDAGVNRISINPQTLKQQTLDSIGRAHTAAQFFEAFRLPEKWGLTISMSI